MWIKRGNLANVVQRVALPLEAALPMLTDIPRAVRGLAPRENCVGTPVAELLLDAALGPVA
ncbi:hypothetical protein AYJ57_20170 [Salipiger sp. CCB-MM3]|uniref:hypothetical protein n=1 Tax=Salipiger sp. CCB-MM3 TaxID=1792508 RepID=UPI00080AB2D9|nr:hypothetical protein [Salipiger sp. CCB-MM3]ANT62693.1 hypothetical protein AYJ57_20170 [Salipiger sp. CCB-MM3]